MSATKEWHFFYDHAPFSFNRAKETQLEGRMRCANELMMAEEYAKESDWEYDWDIDPDAEPVDPADKDEAGEALYCRLVNRHGLVLESLYGIWEPTKEYRRVVEAELALEAMARELGMARPCGQCGRPVSKGPVGYDEECRCAARRRDDAGPADRRRSVPADYRLRRSRGPGVLRGTGEALTGGSRRVPRAPPGSVEAVRESRRAHSR